MNCEKIQDLLSLYLEDKLDPKLKEEVHVHIQHCKDCSQFLEEFKTTINLLKTVNEKELPADYYQKFGLKLDAAQTVLESNKHPFLGIKHNIFIPISATVIILLVGIVCFTFKKDKTVLVANAPTVTNVEKASSPQPQIKVASKIKEINKKTTIKGQRKEIIRTIEFAKADVGKDSQVILRGAGPKYKTKRILKQWQDTNSGIKTKKSLVIKTQKEWQALWETHTGKTGSIPEIDFNKEIVIAVFMGEQKTGGYGIQISEIEETDSNIYIETVETVPSPNTTVTQQLTQPYHIVVISKD
ncbi:MAG: protease complex subunit PrcB family protein [Elusimicrobia bacterium]|nr:protease complex subunit PrcB family protein [Elusimicrobiota bacterium]